MIEISIIIPIRNQIKTLNMALDSLRKQIKNPRLFEIIITDDGSSDGAGEMLKQLRYPIFFKYIYNAPPLGRSANRNQGAAKSSGGTLIFFDGDMVPDREYIDCILSDLTPSIVKVGNVKPPKDADVDSLDRYLYSRGRHEYTDRTSDLPGRYFTSNNFRIDRGLFMKIGGFDPNFIGWGGEDIDFGLRLVESGVSIKYEPDAITYHHHRRTIQSLAADFYSFGENSFEYLINKHPYFLKQLPSRKLGIAAPGFNPGLFDRLISRVTINAAVLKTASLIAGKTAKFAWPDLMFDYILWGHLTLGYRNRKRCVNNDKRATQKNTD